MGWGVVACDENISPFVLLLFGALVDLPVQERILRCELWTLSQTLLRVQGPWARVVESGGQVARRHLYMWANMDDVCEGSKLFTLAWVNR